MTFQPIPASCQLCSHSHAKLRKENDIDERRVEILHGEEVILQFQHEYTDDSLGQQRVRRVGEHRPDHHRHTAQQSAPDDAHRQVCPLKPGILQRGSRRPRPSAWVDYLMSRHDASQLGLHGDHEDTHLKGEQKGEQEKALGQTAEKGLGRSADGAVDTEHDGEGSVAGRDDAVAENDDPRHRHDHGERPGRHNCHRDLSRGDFVAVVVWKLHGEPPVNADAQDDGDRGVQEEGQARDVKFGDQHCGRCPWAGPQDRRQGTQQADDQWSGG